MTLETLSDVAGFLSGVLLLVTALRNDSLSGFIDRMRAVVDEAGKKNALADVKADRVLEALQSELSRWNWIDR